MSLSVPVTPTIPGTASESPRLWPFVTAAMGSPYTLQLARDTSGLPDGSRISARGVQGGDADRGQPVCLPAGGGCPVCRRVAHMLLSPSRPPWGAAGRWQRQHRLGAYSSPLLQLVSAAPIFQGNARYVCTFPLVLHSCRQEPLNDV